MSATEITYFHRNKKSGISIAKVSATLINQVKLTKLVEEHELPAHRADPLSLFKNIWYVFKHRNKIGINHVTGDVHYCLLGLIGCKTILTIHDLNILHRKSSVFKSWFMRLLWFKLPLLIADEVVCISEYTRAALSTFTERRDIKVIYNAIDPSFKQTFKAFNKKCPSVLQIGTGWNKNVGMIINALKDIPSHLTLVGRIDAQLKSLLAANKIDHTVVYEIGDEKLISLYNNCDIVSFCSVYEGFGMPVIEANAIGRCVITSAIKPLTEIANVAARFVDPNDINSVRKGFLDVINNDDLRDGIIQKGKENIKRFNITVIASAYIKLYDNLLVMEK